MIGEVFDDRVRPGDERSAMGHRHTGRRLSGGEHEHRARLVFLADHRDDLRPRARDVDLADVQLRRHLGVIPEDPRHGGALGAVGAAGAMLGVGETGAEEEEDRLVGHGGRFRWE